MTNYIKTEIRNCINRKEFKIMSILVLGMTLISFFAETQVYYGSNLSNVRSAYDVGMIQGINSLLDVLVLMMPMIAIIIYSDAYYSESESGVYKAIVTRTDVQTYLWSKAVISFMMPFVIFLIALLMNQFLSLIAFPVTPYANLYGFPEYSYAMSYSSQVLFSSIRIESPLVYNCIMIFNISLFAGLFGLIGYGVYLFDPKSKFSVFIGVFIGYIAIEIITSVLGIGRLSISTYLIKGRQGSPLILVMWIGLLLAIGVGLCIIGISKKKSDIGI